MNHINGDTQIENIQIGNTKILNNSCIAKKSHSDDKNINDSNITKQVSWNLFSMTGGIDEYMLYRKISDTCKENNK